MDTSTTPRRMSEWVPNARLALRSVRISSATAARRTVPPPIRSNYATPTVASASRARRANAHNFAAILPTLRPMVRPWWWRHDRRPTATAAAAQRIPAAPRRTIATGAGREAAKNQSRMQSVQQNSVDTNDIVRTAKPVQWSGRSEQFQPGLSSVLQLPAVAATAAIGATIVRRL